MALNSNFRTLTADNIEGVVATRNYVKNSFENGSTFGWREMAVSISGGLPSGIPTIGTDGVPNAAPSLTLSVTSTTPLSLDKSLLVNISSALVAGNGFISEAFTLDRMDLGKVITISFDYERTAGAIGTGALDFSGRLGFQTWMVYVYDVNTGAWVQPAGFLGMNQSSGPGRIACTFQSSSVAGQQYRIAVIASQAATGASSFEFDNFVCSRQTAPIGPVVTDFQSYTATTSGFNIGTTGTATTRWRRVGDSIHVIGRYVAGGTGISVSGDLRVFLPTGLSFDTSKISITSTIGAFELHNAGAYRYGGATLAVDTTQVGFSIRQNAATLGNFAGTGTPEVGWFNAGNDEISFEFMAPISGWSSQVQLSNDTDTRVVAFVASKTAAQSVPNLVGSNYTVVNFETVESNTHGAAYSGSSYTIPVSGFYRVSCNFNFQSGSGGTIFTVLFRNGAISARIGTQPFATTQSGGVGSTIVYLNAGETIGIGVAQLTGATQTLEPAGRLAIERLSGPSVIAATENVIAKYSTTAGQAITSSPATVVYATREIDSHGIVNTTTGDITIPISGKYLIGVYGSTASATWASGQQFLWQIRKNGSFSSFINQIRAQAAYTGILESVGPTYIDCLAGDVINIQAQSSVATTLRTAAGTNFFYLVRLGN